MLNSEPAQPEERDLVIKMLALEAVAYAHLHRFPEAEQTLGKVDPLCAGFDTPVCGHVIRARGVLAFDRGQLAQAKMFFQQSLSFAHAHADQFLAATALLNLGVTANRQEYLDEAINWSDEAYRASTALGAGDIAQTALGNLAWAYYYLGDADKSLELSIEAQKLAIRAGDVINQLSNLNNAGYLYAEKRDFVRAKQSYEEALRLARKINNQRQIQSTLQALAAVSVENADLEQARKHSDEAIEIARAGNDRLDELYPLLVKGKIAARSHKETEAERIFREVENDPSAGVSLKWQAEHEVARLFEDMNRMEQADAEYRAAVATFEGARASLRTNDSRLPFSNNGYRIYDDYVHFLVERGEIEEALRWADFNRARSLAEGMGLLSQKTSLRPPLNTSLIARRERAAILFYWLGEKQSYLWAVSPQKTSLFTLPPGKEIDNAVRRFREALAGPQDILTSFDPDGAYLYQTLIAPAEGLVEKEGRVFIIPDGSLNGVNFETFLVAKPKPHYWIEDATITNASSLRLLSPTRENDKKQRRNLLLIGNSVAPNPKYPELPKAAMQVEGVAGHFPPTERQLLTREQATPAAYLNSHLEQFSHIHFVAHGIASRLSPLDSAIVLSKNSTQDDSFKLYARDIIRHPVQADLVTISACYGAEGRTYSGEGLVGLSWAFLKAGAHNVIAALWEATDAPTEQLMNKFYSELDKGATPDAALRTAKLSLLRDTGFRNPFYWAPFQLYAGSYRGADSVLTDHSSSKVASARSH